MEPDGLVAIYAVSSTVSGNGDVGADPNKVYLLLDALSNTSATAPAAMLPAYEVTGAKFGEVLRGVSFTPDTDFAKIKNLY